MKTMNQSDQNKVQEEVLSVGQWFLTTFVMGIPLVGLIMLFVWGFGPGNQNRANFCKAVLIWCAISIVLTAILFTMVGAGIIAALSGIS